MNGLKEQRYGPGPVNFNPFEEEKDRRFVPVPEAVKTDLPYSPGPVDFDPFEIEEIEPEQVRGLKPPTRQPEQKLPWLEKPIEPVLGTTAEEALMVPLQVLRGTQELAAGVGAGIQWLGNRLDNKIIKEAGQKLGDYYRKEAERIGQPKSIAGKNVFDDPELLANPSYWIANTAQMAPSLAAAMIPAVGAAKTIQVAGQALNLTPALVARLASLGAAATGGAVGGAMEGAQTYQTMLDEGADEKEAARASELMFVFAGTLNAVGINKVLAKAGNTLKAKVIQKLGAGAWEGLTEAGEEPAEVTSKLLAKYLTGQELPGKEEIGDMFFESMKAGLTVLGPAALTGVGAATAFKAPPPTGEPTDLLDIVEPGAKYLKAIESDVKKGLITPEQLQDLGKEFRQKFPQSTKSIQDFDSLIETQAQVQPIELTEVVEEGAIPLEEVVPPEEAVIEPEPIEIEPEVVEPVEEPVIEEEIIPEEAKLPTEEVKTVPPVKAKAEEVGVPIPEVKEPWEMSKDEWLRSKTADEGQFRLLKADKIVGATMIKAQHEVAVRDAISEGKITSHPDYPELGKVEPTTQEIDKAAKETETDLTEAQKKTGKYEKGRINLHGFDIDIENPKGSVRSGVDRQGKKWSIKLKHHYGEILGVKGKDKDWLDVFIGPNPESDKVFVIDQVDPATGNFDEHKILMGFPTEKQARVGYLANYERAWKGLGEITELTTDEFKKWIEEGDTTKPIKLKAKPTPEEVRVKATEAERKARETQLKKAASQKYLIPWIAASGGVKPMDLSGEIKDIIWTVDAKGKKKIMRDIPPGFLSGKGKTLDVIVRDARESGFDVRDEDHLLELIERDLAAKTPEERVTKIKDIEEKLDILTENYYKEREDLADEIDNPGDIPKAEADLEASLKGEITDETAAEDEFARLEREAIQGEYEGLEPTETFLDDQGFELKPTEPTPEEKIAIGKERGEIVAPEKAKKKPVIPTEKIPVATKGEQVSLLPPVKGEQITIEGAIDEKAKFDSGVDKVKESDVQYIYDPASIQKQYSLFDFKPAAPARTKEAPATGEIPPGQRVRVHTTDDVRASGTIISGIEDVDSLLAPLRHKADEEFYSVVVDKDGIILEVHHFGKGTRGAAVVSATEVAGRALNIPDVHRVYLVHNHPTGKTRASEFDIDLTYEIESLLKAGDVKTDHIVIGATKYQAVPRVFADSEVNAHDIPPMLRKVTIPVKGRYLVRRADLEKREKVNQPTAAIKAFETYANNANGILFLNNDNRPLTFLPFIKGRSMKETTKDIVKVVESTNANAMIINNNTVTPQMTKYLQALTRGRFGGDVTLVDIIENGESWVGRGLVMETKDVLDYTILLSETKLIEDIKDTLKDERGSISFERMNKDHPAVYDNLVTVGTDVIREGHTKYSDFAKQMKSKFAEIWDKIRNIMMRVWRAASAKLKEETGAIDFEKIAPEEYEKLSKEEKKEWTKEYFQKVIKGPVSKEELAKAVKKPKKLIRILTGQIKFGDFIREDIALTATIRKAAQAARVAFREGRKEEVARYREIIAKARERRKLRVLIRNMVKNMKKALTGVDKMSPEHGEPIKNLLDGIDLVRMNKKTELRLTKTREFLENDPDAEVPSYVEERVKRLDKKNLNDISLDELISVYTAVMHHVHLNKLKNKIKVGRERRRAKQVLQSSISEMRNPKVIENEIVSSQPGTFKGVKKIGSLLKDTFGIRHDHFDLIIESLAGANSTMDKVLFQEIKKGIINQLRYKQEVYSKYNEDLGNFSEKYDIEDISAWLNEEIETGRFKFTRGERMALYRHSLNNDNRRAILEGGFGFKTSDMPNAVHRMTEDELNAILDNLTDAEKAFAGKGVDNLFEAQAKELDRIFYEKNGYPMPKEDNYYPKDVMPLSRGIDLEKEEALEKFRGRWTRIGLEKGMLEKRKRVKNPIYLNSIAYDLNKSVMKAAAYIGLELPLSNASKLLYDKNFRRELSNRYGEQTWREIEKGLRDIAGDWQTYTTTEELLIRAKNNLSTAFLGLNPFVMFKQVLSFPVYLPYVKAEYLAQGMLDFISHPLELSERHKMYSPEYLERVEGGYSRDVADVFKKAAQKRMYAGKATIKEKFMGGIQLFDKFAIIPGMQGAVLQVLDEFAKGKLSREVKTALDMEDSDIANLTAKEEMKLAYKFADYATERTQPMFSPEHRSSLSRGASIEKLGTMFGSFTNQALNLMRRSYREAARTKDPGAYKKLAKSLFVIMVINTLGVMLIDDLRDKILGRKKKRLLPEILDTWAGYMFFIRDLASSVISKIEKGTFLGYDVEWPVGRIPELLSNTIANGVGAFTAKDEDKEKQSEKRKKMAFRFIDDALSLSLMMYGIPYETPKKLGKVGIEVLKYGALPISKARAMNEFVDEWVEIKSGEKAKRQKTFATLKKKVKGYNEIQKKKDEKIISWSTIGKKGINIIKAERAGEKRKAVNY